MPPSEPTVRTIQHEHALIDAGLRLVVGAWPEFHVLPADSPSEQLDAADVVVLDHDTALRRRHPSQAGGPNALVVSSIGQETNVREALEAGVQGFVSASRSVDEIRMAARIVAAARRYLCGAASLCIADYLARPSLTAREFEVVALVSRGRNNEEVARLLGVSVGTVKSHMRALLAKLGAHCRTEAMWIASQRGLIPRPEEPGPVVRSASMPQRPRPKPPAQAPLKPASTQRLCPVALDPVS